ncbi:hypothetical protein [Leptolinea tardivitalis]|uniref:Uncharacterized protein n=1 Tax=Leptolinea tardivitalis TaxID=229920 RepID=A0A0N8GLJ5_9CHLR|nr:hypothetical protein [Leptolinea tardivitalis]KPL72674.1 hypothetical protein ADM99_06185 [Leptolinea tardivitalis]GAP20988.1 hypothetical protein LTAR_01193 [Leptolinea tardivitalis]
MTRVIATEGGTRERTRLSKAVVKAIRLLAQQEKPDDESRDLAAFISIALDQMYKSVETSVVAWEKKDYWVKADRFRMEWEWCSRASAAMEKAVLSDDWGTVASTAGLIAQKLMKVQLAPGARVGTPWVGAYKQLKTSSK